MNSRPPTRCVALIPERGRGPPTVRVPQKGRGQRLLPGPRRQYQVGPVAGEFPAQLPFDVGIKTQQRRGQRRSHRERRERQRKQSQGADRMTRYRCGHMTLLD